jgi:hypothetical protein
MPVTACVLVIAAAIPVNRLQATIDDGIKRSLPAQAVDWEHIGTFRLKDNKGQMSTVRLYVYDSNEVARKRGDLQSTPNDFAVHALYCSGGGKWTHKKLWAVGGLSFEKIPTESTKSVVIEVAPGGLRALTPDEYKKRKPMTKTVRVVDGVPTLE